MWMAASEVRSHTLHIHRVYPFGRIPVTLLIKLACFSAGLSAVVCYSAPVSCCGKCSLLSYLKMLFIN